MRVQACSLIRKKGQKRPDFHARIGPRCIIHKKDTPLKIPSYRLLPKPRNCWDVSVKKTCAKDARARTQDSDALLCVHMVVITLYSISVFSSVHCSKNLPLSIVPKRVIKIWSCKSVVGLLMQRRQLLHTLVFIFSKSILFSLSSYSKPFIFMYQFCGPPLYPLDSVRFLD